MSNFGTLSQVSGGYPGTAPQIWSASTPDSLVTITTAGYLDDLGDKVKQNDVFYINYLDTSTQPLGGVTGGEHATLGEFYANVSGGHMNLVNALTALGTAAAKAATNNALPDVASTAGSGFTIGNLVSASDTAGSIQDSGFNVANLTQHARVTMTAAQWNGMYATPFLLVAAPGANKMNIIEQIDLGMTFVSADYAAGGVVGAQYGNTAHGAGSPASTTEAAADFFAGASTMFKLGSSLGTGAAFSAAANAGIYLSNLTGAFTTGDSTWIIDVYYRTVATV
jgi:hypothetical protein